LHVLQQLVSNVRECDDMGLSALVSIAATNQLFTSALKQGGIWEMACLALGLDDDRRHHDCKRLVHAIVRADAAFRDRAAAPSASMCVLTTHAAKAHGGGGLPGWMDPLLEELLPLGLVRVVAGVEDEKARTLAAPYTVIKCDAADPDRPVARGALLAPITYPCADRSCLQPAAPACAHCGKHGGKSARRIVQRYHESLSTGCGRRVIFVPLSASVRDAYCRAVRNVAVRNVSRKVRGTQHTSISGSNATLDAVSGEDLSQACHSRC
jgi:hypothetical protein